MHKPGEVVLAQVQFTDTFEVKLRPAVVLFEEYGNVVVAGVTSNTQMKGIPITKAEGAVADSVVKVLPIHRFRGHDQKNPIYPIGRKACTNRGRDRTPAKKPIKLELANCLLVGEKL